MKFTIRCDHGKDDGCMWCCEQCNRDMHFCPDCGTVTDHRNRTCEEWGEKCDT